MTQYDPLININWGTEDLIGNVAANYVSIEWSGFLLPVFSETYTFEVNCNDGVKLWVGDTLIIDMLVDVENELNGHVTMSSPVDLTADTFVPIRIQYYEAVD